MVSNTIQCGFESHPGHGAILRSARPAAPTLDRVPLLRYDDPLPHLPARVTVNGTSGAGKTTLARRIADLLGLPHTEMDSLFHGPGWTRLPDFAAKVDVFTSEPRWVCEYQYDEVRPMIAARADLLVWLDLPVALAMWRVCRRTVSRRLRRAELWNGNREGPLLGLLGDPEHVVRYAWSTRHDAAARVDAVRAQRPELPVVRLASPRQVERWLRGPLEEARSACTDPCRSGPVTG